jgi:PAS domain S-box-containing protein
MKTVIETDRKVPVKEARLLGSAELISITSDGSPGTTFANARSRPLLRYSSLGKRYMDGTELREILIRQAPDAVVFADLEGIIREWNPAAERVFGHSREEAVGHSLDIIVPERFREAHWRGYERALSEGRTKYNGQALPTRSFRKDGSAIYVELTFAIVRDPKGGVIGALAHARDISQRRAEERKQRGRLQELEQRLREATAAEGDPA